MRNVNYGMNIFPDLILADGNGLVSENCNAEEIFTDQRLNNYMFLRFARMVKVHGVIKPTINVTR